MSATQTTTENIALSRLPAGRLSGVVRDADQQPVAGVQIRVPGTPVSTTTGGDGRYLLTLPAGSDRPVAVGRRVQGADSISCSILPRGARPTS